jgi:preprotein translocase subunit YajC
MNAALAVLMVPREGGSAGLVFMSQMVLIFIIFYFLLIRPQTKERQRHETGENTRVTIDRARIAQVLTAKGTKEE